MKVYILVTAVVNLAEIMVIFLFAVREYRVELFNDNMVTLVIIGTG